MNSAQLVKMQIFPRLIPNNKTMSHIVSQNRCTIRIHSSSHLLS